MGEEVTPTVPPAAATAMMVDQADTRVGRVPCKRVCSAFITSQFIAVN